MWHRGDIIYKPNRGVFGMSRCKVYKRDRSGTLTLNNLGGYSSKILNLKLNIQYQVNIDPQFEIWILNCHLHIHMHIDPQFEIWIITWLIKKFFQLL